MDQPMPTRPMAATNRFTSDHHDSILRDAQDNNVHFLAQAKASWKAMPEHDQQDFTKRFESDKALIKSDSWMQNPPKKALNAYMLFIQDQRENVKRANPIWSTKDVVRHLANLWRTLAVEHKEPYLVKAGQAKAVFTEQKKRWDTQLQSMSKAKPKKGSAAAEKLQKAKDKKKLKKKKKFKDPLRPKKPMPAFMHFSMANRDRVKKANPESRVADISKELGRQWHAMSPADKVPFQELQHRDQARYAQQMTSEVQVGAVAKARANKTSMLLKEPIQPDIPGLIYKIDEYQKIMQQTRQRKTLELHSHPQSLDQMASAVMLGAQSPN